MDASPAELRVVVLTPIGRDAAIAEAILGAAGIAAVCCADARAVQDTCAAGAGAILLAEEAILPDGAAPLLEFLQAQPPWSDIPILMLTGGGVHTAATQRALAQLAPHGNVTLFERPVRRMTLVAAVETALRARRRQYAMRAQLEERRALLDQAERSRAAAEQANRAKDQFLAVLSHELRSPLQGLRGWIEVMRRPQADEAHRMRAIEAIDRIVAAQSQLVNDLLDVSRIAAGKLDVERVPLELTPVVRAVVDEASPGAEAKGVALACDLADVGMVVGDAERLRQVVGNLLSNAIKFTAAGGRVVVECRRQAGRAVLAVSDDGAGIDPSFLPHVFDRFSQADASTTRRHGGLGLGLAIARDLVLLHAGEIEAHSAGEGQGARFVVRLPLAPAPPARPAPVSNGAHGPKLQGTRVLLVEDDPDALEALTLVLEHSGAEVVPTGSAAAAMAAFRAAQPDVLVSDISMPDEDGYSLLARIRAAEGREQGAPRLPAVALTGFAAPADRARAVAAGFHAHLAKPVEPDALVAVLHSLLRRPRKPGAADI